jgi:hypothetical protein
MSDWNDCDMLATGKICKHSVLPDTVPGAIFVAALQSPPTQYKFGRACVTLGVMSTALTFKEAQDAEGRIYYYHSVTKVTCWEVRCTYIFVGCC